MLSTSRFSARVVVPSWPVTLSMLLLIDPPEPSVSIRMLVLPSQRLAGQVDPVSESVPEISCQPPLGDLRLTLPSKPEEKSRFAMVTFPFWAEFRPRTLHPKLITWDSEI